jgi:magnesium chelatase family protein
MLARRLTTILPAMTLAEAIETTRIPRVPGLTGGHVPLPGEGSRAHHGLLWLDELLKCTRHVLEV